MNFLSHYLSKKPIQNRVIIIFPHITAAPCVAVIGAECRPERRVAGGGKVGPGRGGENRGDDDEEYP